MATFRDLNPSTGECLAEIPVTTAAELVALCAAARSARAEWSSTPFEERARLLREGAKGLEERAEEVADAITREMGKPRGDALREVQGWSVHVDELLGEVARAIETEVITTDDTETHLVRDPLGVVAAITPWNFPVGMPLSILIPALATGNTVVFKPSEHVPLTGALLAEIFGGPLPDGVLALAQGEGDVGAALVNADVDMIGFVGSRDTGAAIMKAAGDDLKRLVLELGGKDPLVVFEDADLESAAECAVRHALRNTGQVCCSVERIYVAEPVYDRFEELVVEKAREWVHGDGFDPKAKMGPMVSERQREKVEVQVADAVRNGARLLLGGETPEGEGAFYPATVLGRVGQDLLISREETFGPVVSLTPFDGSEAEAVRLANDTPYGLGASVYTADSERGLRVAGHIRSGQVGVNRYLGGAPGTPWVGARQSGFGFLGGVEGHRQFTIRRASPSRSRPDAGPSGGAQSLGLLIAAGAGSAASRVSIP